MTTRERLIDASAAFDHPVTIGVTAAILLGLLAATVAIGYLNRKGKLSEATYRELRARTRSWYVLAAVMIVPVLLGALWVWAFFLLLSLFCYREYARATNLAAARSATIPVVAAILLAYFAVVDHWMGLFTTAWPLGVCLIAVAGLLPDQPQGYIRRLALAIVGFALVGMSLGHLAYMSNDELFRPMLVWILLCVELNDVFAYLAGKTLGRNKLIPNTSPNKTREGALGAIVMTTTLSAVVGHYVFRGTSLDHVGHLIAMGLIISVLGQCGDLVISSIKRDLNIKDMAATIPGHGGLLDRFDSLLLVAPALFHYINYCKIGGIGSDQSVRILTGG